MKRIIIMMSMATVSVCAHADAMFMNPTNAEQCVSNAWMVSNGSTDRAAIVRTITRGMKMPESVRTQMDRLISSAPDVTILRIDRPRANMYPMTARAISAAIRESNPYYSVLLGRWVDGEIPTERENLAGLIGMYMYNCVVTENSLDLLGKNALALATKNVRIKLRSEGRAITEKDGVDPVKVILDRIAYCLNAPRLAGLRDAMEEAGIDIPQPEFSWIPTSNSTEGTKLLNDVYIGDVKMDSRITAQLRYMLGTEGYNSFVERYNGGTR